MTWMLEFDDGRQVLVYQQLFNTARAALVNARCHLFLDDAW